MTSELKGILLGGPKDGEVVIAADTPGARSDEYKKFKNPVTGEVAAIYQREPVPRQDGVYRFKCVWHEGQDDSRLEGFTEGGEAERRPLISLTLNESTQEWELKFESKVIGSCPRKQINSREDAESFRDEYRDAIKELGEAFQTG